MRPIHSYFKYTKGIKKRIHSIGFLNTLRELNAYFRFHVSLVKKIGSKPNLKYHFYIIYTYNKACYFVPDLSQDLLLNILPRQIQWFLLPITNPSKYKESLVDKIKFYKLLNNNEIPYPRVFFYVKNNVVFDFHDRIIDDLSSYSGGLYFAKEIGGSAGEGAHVLSFNGNFSSLKNNFLYQEVQKNHVAFLNLAPIKAFCTIRVNGYLTQNKKVEIQSAFLKLSLGDVVDNLSAGIGISVDLETGYLNEYGYSFYSGKLRQNKHPLGVTCFKDFKVPYWRETIELVNKMHFLFPNSRNISWDIGITDNGPVVIEGNSGGGIFFTQIICKPYFDTVMIQENISKYK